MLRVIDRNSQPLRLKLDPALSVEAMIGRVLEEAQRRKWAAHSPNYVATVLHYLVGGILEMIFERRVFHSTHFLPFGKDHPGLRTGEFVINDSVLYVTDLCTEVLIEMCKANIAAKVAPAIVTRYERATVAHAFAEDARIQERVEVLALEQFLAAFILERSRFQPAQRNTTIIQLIDKYNSLIDEFESDPSLTIEIDMWFLRSFARPRQPMPFRHNYR